MNSSRITPKRMEKKKKKCDLTNADTALTQSKQAQNHSKKNLRQIQDHQIL